MSTPLNSILVYGGGLAFEYAATMLSHALPPNIELTIIHNSEGAEGDGSYGSVMPPTAYDFHRALGIEEPDLILKTNTGLSYGTHYTNWAAGLDWVQCYQLPLPIWNGVRFHHYLTRLGAPLEPFLPGAVAGRAGRFAHPPEDPKVPLSRAEYGYQFCPRELANLLKGRPTPQNVRRIDCRVGAVESSETGITSVTLASGDCVSADLYVDASGPSGALISALKSRFMTDYSVSLNESEAPATTGGSPLRLVKGTNFGWTATTPLRDKTKFLSVSHPDNREAALAVHGNSQTTGHDVSVGNRDQAWTNNCVAVGHAAAVLEPLTTAPFLLLMRDIERLISLLPHSVQMDVEAREYNRRFREDIEHASLFHDALFQSNGFPETGYYQAIIDNTVHEKLIRKITQFESRGDLVAYDLEPFNEQDWTILHFGMGRRADRHDIYIDNLTDKVIEQNLIAMKQAISGIAGKMPLHGIYLNKMQQYLERKHGRDV